MKAFSDFMQNSVHCLEKGLKSRILPPWKINFLKKILIEPFFLPNFQDVDPTLAAPNMGKVVQLEKSLNFFSS